MSDPPLNAFFISANLCPLCKYSSEPQDLHHIHIS